MTGSDNAPGPPPPAREPLRRPGAAALAARVVEEATRLGVATLYLFTLDREGYYARLGWRRLGPETCHGHPVVVMTRDLPAR